MKRGRDSSGRLPFNPGRVKPRAAGDDAPPAKATASVITVSELTRMVKGALTTALPSTLSVVGEISNLSQPSGGHLYFTLKDATSELRCVMWRSSAGSMKFKPVDGMAIVATGSIDVYEPRGQYQFYVRRLEPQGVGALEFAFQQLKEKLGKEGLFDPARKRPLPAFPRRIAIVTSTTGAAVRDILQTIARRFPVVEVSVFGVRVQGDGAADEIADAIRRINASSERLGGVDVLIVGRGGGSLEDLWAFNEEAVARAIYKSAIPVVSAVGHEVDFSIADFVADVRAATPTAAAEIVVPVLADVLDGLDALGRNLRRSTTRIVEECRARLAVAQKAEWFRDPIGRVHQYQQQIDELVSRLRLAESRLFAARRNTVHQLEMRLSRVRPEAQLARRRERLARFEQRLTIAALTNLRHGDSRLSALAVRLSSASPQISVEHNRNALAQFSNRLSRSAMRAQADAMRLLDSLEKRLQAGSHEAVLNRGFSITRRVRGMAVVRCAKAVREGDRLETQTADGVITSRVSDANQAELFE